MVSSASSGVPAGVCTRRLPDLPHELFIYYHQNNPQRFEQQFWPDFGVFRPDFDVFWPDFDVFWPDFDVF